jgi:hypothetical protein
MMHAGTAGGHAIRPLSSAQDAAAHATSAGAGQIGRQTNLVPDAGAGSAPDAAPEVWAGQLWSLAPVLCDPDDPRQLQRDMISAEGHTERVVLVLRPDSAGGWRGDIRFGEGVLPDHPDKDLQSNTGNGYSFWFCSLSGPAKGGDYTLLAVSWRADALVLTVSFNEIWNDWCHRERFMCTAQSGACTLVTTCTCQNGDCSADISVLFRIELARTGDRLEGPLSIFAGGTAAQLRLLRVQ